MTLLTLLALLLELLASLLKSPSHGLLQADNMHLSIEFLIIFFWQRGKVHVQQSWRSFGLHYCLSQVVYLIWAYPTGLCFLGRMLKCCVRPHNV